MTRRYYAVLTRTDMPIIPYHVHAFDSAARRDAWCAGPVPRGFDVQPATAHAALRDIRADMRLDDAFLDGPNADMAVYALAKSLAAKIEDPGPSVDIRRFSKRLAQNGAVSDAYLEDGDWRRVPVGETLLVTGCAEEEPRLRALMEKVMWSVKDERKGRDA